MYTFPNKAEFGEVVQPDLKRYGGRLILYGAGKVAEVVDYVLRQRGIEYLCFCDTYRAGGTHCGHPVISPEELNRDYPGVPVLVTTTHHRSVVELLEGYGPREILDSVPLLAEVDFSNWGMNGEQMTKEWAVETITSYLITMLAAKNPMYCHQLSVFVTQKCTLRCLDCSTLTPYFQAPVHYRPDVVKRSLKNLFSYEEMRVQEIDLLGGEPLLYPDLAELLECSLSLCGQGQVSIVTNGTLLPKEDLIPLMQDPKFFMIISDYGALSTKKDALLELLVRCNIRYELNNYAEWYENRCHLVEPCGEDAAQKKWRACRFTTNKSLVDGRLFPCCKAASLCQLGVFAATEENSIDCLELEELGERLRTGLRRFTESHIDICHRCTGVAQSHPDRMVPPAIQAEGRLTLS